MPRAMADHIQICRKRHARRGAPKADLDRRHWNVRFVPIAADSCTAAKQHRLLDDLVRQRAQLIRHSQSECFGGLHVDHQLELDWSLDRKLARLLAFEDTVGIGRRTPVLIDENRTVRDQAAS
jgi:hypothetical protein